MPVFDAISRFLYCDIFEITTKTGISGGQNARF